MDRNDLNGRNLPQFRRPHVLSVDSWYLLSLRRRLVLLYVEWVASHIGASPMSVDSRVDSAFRSGFLRLSWLLDQNFFPTLTTRFRERVFFLLIYVLWVTRRSLKLSCLRHTEAKSRLNSFTRYLSVSNSRVWKRISELLASWGTGWKCGRQLSVALSPAEVAIYGPCIPT